MLFRSVPVVAVAAALVFLPSLYLLYSSTQILHEVSSRNAALSVVMTVILWALVIVFTLTQISAVN